MYFKLLKILREVGQTMSTNALNFTPRKFRSTIVNYFVYLEFHQNNEI